MTPSSYDRLRPLPHRATSLRGCTIVPEVAELASRGVTLSGQCGLVLCALLGGPKISALVNIFMIAPDGRLVTRRREPNSPPDRGHLMACNRAWTSKSTGS